MGLEAPEVILDVRVLEHVVASEGLERFHTEEAEVHVHRKEQVVDLSNNPFARPDLEVFVSGLEWIRAPENNYPIRGTYL